MLVLSLLWSVVLVLLDYFKIKLLQKVCFSSPSSSRRRFQPLEAGPTLQQRPKASHFVKTLPVNSLAMSRWKIYLMNVVLSVVRPPEETLSRNKYLNALNAISFQERFFHRHYLICDSRGASFSLLFGIKV
jgi:hypothetical protein